MKRFLFSSALVTTLCMTPAFAEPEIAKYIGGEPQAFAEPSEAVDVFRKELAAKNVPGLAKLIGLNPDEIGKSDDFDSRLDELQGAASERLQIVEDGPDKRIINLGDLIWPFPFPLVKGDDGKWSFDTNAGLEEILDRRIGENELEALDTMTNYVVAQTLYHDTDWDEDGVHEYAQTLRSSPGKMDGLYWPAEEHDGVESPVGPFIDEEKALSAKDSPTGYFGYRYRVLTKQGDNIAGGAYDYVINGNMIAGFALIATPAKYGETGIMTFMISNEGSIYEKDLGEDSEAAAAKIDTFNPDKDWELVAD
ncbi:DUF2950 family protein [Terrihabitans soli]|nr:DUF2950 family protein [Terrihabitans soli]